MEETTTQDSVIKNFEAAIADKNPNLFLNLCCENKDKITITFLESILNKAAKKSGWAQSLSEEIELRKNISNIELLFWHRLLWLSPANTNLRKIIKSLSMQDSDYILNSVVNLESETGELTADSFYHVKSKKDELNKLLASQNKKITYTASRSLEPKNGFPKDGIPLRIQIQKDGSTIERKEGAEPTLNCFVSIKDKKLLAAIDFDDEFYFNPGLLLKNLLVAMNNYIRSNGTYSGCVIVTGKIEPTLIAWLFNPRELQKEFNLSIDNIEILYLLKDDQKNQFFYYPIRSNSSPLRILGEKDFEDSWKYISLSELLKTSWEEFEIYSNDEKAQNPSHYKTILFNNFEKQVQSVKNPLRDTINISKSLDDLVIESEGKLENYLRSLYEEAKHIPRAKSEFNQALNNLGVVQKHDDILDVNLGVILNQCKIVFKLSEKIQYTLKSNINEIRKSNQGGIALDWNHILQDVVVKGIDYTKTVEGKFSLASLLAENKLDIYSEELPYYSYETYTFYYDGSLFHSRKFTTQIEELDVKKSEENRIKNRETFWQIKLEHVLINIFIMLARKELNTEERDKLLDIIVNTLSGHIEKLEPIYNRFLDSFRNNHLKDIEKNPQLGLLYNRERVRIFLNNLKGKLSEKNKKPFGERNISANISNNTQEQYENAYNSLLNSQLPCGFNISDMYALLNAHTEDCQVKQDQDLELKMLADRVNISIEKVKNIINFLASLTFNSEFENEKKAEIEKLDPYLFGQEKYLYVRRILNNNYVLAKFIYVIVDEDVFLAPESFFRVEGSFTKHNQTYKYSRPAHSQLACGKSVKAAGECIFQKIDKKWYLLFITNGSGHYRPNAFDTLPIAEEQFKAVLSPMGDIIDISGLKLRNTLTPNITLEDSQYELAHIDLQIGVDKIAVESSINSEPSNKKIEQESNNFQSSAGLILRGFFASSLKTINNIPNSSQQKAETKLSNEAEAEKPNP